MERTQCSIESPAKPPLHCGKLASPQSLSHDCRALDGRVKDSEDELVTTIHREHLKMIGLVNLLIRIIYHNNKKKQTETLIRKKNERRKWDEIIESRLCGRRG